MRLSVVALSFILPAAALAQSHQGMSEQDMQKMMQQAQRMQACMQNVDQGKLKALERRSNQFKAEVDALCAKGERAKAQAKAMSFGREISSDATMKEMRKCSAMMKGMMPKMPFMEQHEKGSKGHICD
jgi:hypothetical protein